MVWLNRCVCLAGYVADVLAVLAVLAVTGLETRIVWLKRAVSVVGSGQAWWLS